MTDIIMAEAAIVAGADIDYSLQKNCRRGDRRKQTFKIKNSRVDALPTHIFNDQIAKAEENHNSKEEAEAVVKGLNRNHSVMTHDSYYKKDLDIDPITRSKTYNLAVLSGEIYDEIESCKGSTYEEVRIPSKRKLSWWDKILLFVLKIINKLFHKE